MIGSLGWGMYSLFLICFRASTVVFSEEWDYAFVRRSLLLMSSMLERDKAVLLR